MDTTRFEDYKQSEGRFLSLMTHELRAPLHTINGYLDLALSGAAGDLEPELHSFLQRARSSSEHLFNMLENLLLFARADAGQLRLKRDIVCLQELFTDLVEEMEVTAQDKNITVEIKMSADFPRFYADAERLQQVMRNLLSNALRFTSEGGKVEIAAGIESSGQEKIVNLSVSDNGEGIAQDQQGRIFERFFRGHVGGQGLGLAVVKLLVELQGGEIKVRSKPGEGSNFQAIIPVLLVE